MNKDFVYAARGLRKRPGFTAIATVTIALGIGACTAIFSVVHAVLLRPLPYAEAQRLVVVWGELRARHVDDWPFSSPDYRDLRLQSSNVFEDIAGYSAAGRAPISEKDAEPEQVLVAGATWNAFRVLGARVLVGRDFTEEDAVPQAQPQPGQPPPPPLAVVAIISNGLWKRRFGGDPAIVGKAVDLGNGRAQIVGVLAPEFELLFAPRANLPTPDMWTAARINYETSNRNNVQWRLVGRLKPGVTVQQAQTQADRVADDLRKAFPIKTTAGLYFHVVPMHDDLVRDVRPAIVSLMGAVAFVLLIACANVANLLIVRASARGRELALCAAIGGTRWQLVRQMLAESLLIAGVGTALGVVLARAGVDLLIVLAPADVPRLTGIAVDPVALAFAVGTGALTAILCGIVPAMRASRADVMDVLRSGGGHASGLRAGRAVRNSVVIAEVALSVVLLVGAGLMLRSVLVLQRVDPGYDPGNVLTFQLQARQQQEGQREAFIRQVRARLTALPGVVGVTAALPLPLDGTLINGRWGTEAAVNDPSKFRQANFHVVLPGYFETMKTRLIAGRTFTDADNHADDPKAGAPRVIVIDDQTAALAFPNQTAVGKRLLARAITPEPEWFEVIGVVAHQRHAGLGTPGPEALFFTDAYFGQGAVARWAVRTTGDPSQIAVAVSAAIRELDPRSIPAEIKPMQAFVDKAMAPIRFTATLIGIFSAVATLLAAIGLYGVLSTVVRQRTAEIGLRMVFGAAPASILNLVVVEGLRLSAIGIVVGVAGALAANRLIGSLLVGVGATDPLTFVGIVVLFALVAAAASWLPAYRAARLEPMSALREE